MNRLKRWLRKKLRGWLGMEAADRRIGRVNESAVDFEGRLGNLEGVMLVGADIHHIAPSWAVVCISGKSDFIKMVALPSNDIQEIARFLRQFEKRGGQVRVDAPRGMESILANELRRRP